jgi:hypothetical protein
VFTADDIGDQRGCFLPIELWAKLMLPPTEGSTPSSTGTRQVIYHSDGAAMDAVSGLIGRYRRAQALSSRLQADPVA